jgi:hypothetical protein
VRKEGWENVRKGGVCEKERKEGGFEGKGKEWRRKKEGRKNRQA